MSTPSQGVVCAISAYVLWGLLPLYWKALQAVAPVQILAHRIVWSFLFLMLIVALQRGWSSLRTLLSDRKAAVLYSLASALLALNWLTYIYGVNSSQIVETSLGYFINPLLSVLLGVVFLHERLRRSQWVAIAFAAGGVAYLTWRVGHLPWLALVLATSFGLYGFAKKRAPAGALAGLTFETGVLFGPAFVLLLFLEGRGNGAFGHAPLATNLLLALAGAVTAIPLLLFARAARAVSLSTMGLLQYLSPTCGLVIGVAVYHEPFDRERLVGFSLIWLGLLVYWAEGAWRWHRGRSGG